MKWAICCIIFLPWHAHAMVASARPKTPCPTFINDNQHTIELNTTISLDKPKLADCTQFQGQRLRECMACQTKENFRKNMLALDDHTALAYWKSLDIKEYVQGLSYFTPEQWAEFYQSRKPENRSLFPHRLDWLLREVKRIYVIASYFTIIGMWPHDPDNTSDLKEIIQKYEYNLTHDITIIGMRLKNMLLEKDFEAVKHSAFK